MKIQQGTTAEASQRQELRLAELLQQWRTIEPHPDFKAAVWRRIALAAAEAAPRREGFLVLREWLGVQPAWANAVAALIAVAIGLGSALVWAPAAPTGLTISAPTLQGQTLAGNYLAMTRGGSR